jgi:hypothetical protein
LSKLSLRAKLDEIGKTKFDAELAKSS